MSDISADKKRIAKNTLLLYVRMLFMMLVSLYTSRVILEVLGVNDYGIYNVVGGLVTMFSMLSGSLSASITRFITYELGREGHKRLNNIFSTAVSIQLGISIVIIFLAETIGLWFLNTKINIPDNRMIAANWVFQFSILTFVVYLLSVPYNASIIAHERMSAFAYISILEAISKLVIVLFLKIAPADKLIVYACLMSIVAIFIRFVYGLYCKKHFKECSYRLHLDKSLLKEMSGFAGWNFIGASSMVARDQGGNILINLFCGPSVNAARGIAFQVNGVVQGFVSNFMTALKPQITKSYASGNQENMINLINQGARFSFYMLLILSIPILAQTNYILELWLGFVPEHTVNFVQLVLILGICESISQPLITAMLATGRIRNYQIVVGGLQIMNLPVSYMLLHIGCIPEIVLLTAIVVSLCCLIARLCMLRKMINLPIYTFVIDVCLNVIMVSVISAIVPFILADILAETFMNFILICVLAIVLTIFVIYYVGCNRNERYFMQSKLNEFKAKYLRR